MSYDFPQNCPFLIACATVCNECYLQAFFSVETYVQRLKIKYLKKVKKSLPNSLTGDETACFINEYHQRLWLFKMGSPTDAL